VPFIAGHDPIFRHIPREGSLGRMRETLLTHVAGNGEAMVGALKRLCGIQSGSHNKAGVDAMARAIQEAFADTPYRVALHPMETHGDLVTISSPACGERGHILLLGHMDTVFPSDTPFTWWREDGDRINAPGALDMKGGLVVGIFALRALAAAGLAETIPIRFLCNSDEEIGSLASRDLITQEARSSAMAFVLEGGGANGGLVTGRKGRRGIRLECQGQAGHAAFAPLPKPSAVLALATHILRLEALNGGRPGVTVNVGRIDGGIGPNTVPDRAGADVDVRFMDPEGDGWFEEELDRILSGEPPVPGTNTASSTVGHRPPMPPTEGNRALYRIAEAQAASLGIQVEEEHRAGVSDANLIAAVGTPVLDGMGPLGGSYHSDGEYILAPTLVQRCKLLTLTLEAAWRDRTRTATV